MSPSQWIITGGQRAAGHQDHLAAQALDEAHLLLVGCLNRSDAEAWREREVIRAGAGCDPPTHSTRLDQRAANKFPRRRPVKPHAALGRVHGLGDGEPERPQIAPVRQRHIPVERDLQRRVDVRQRIADNMRRRVSNPAAQRPVGRMKSRWWARSVGR
jgi:hypothetical protein